MKFKHTEWTIRELTEMYANDKIILSPDYQRNYIWTSKDQSKLINTILKHQPIPNFFLMKKHNEKFEMVDGQQRARTIIGFLNGIITDLDKQEFSSQKYPNDFLDYPLSITIITELEKDEEIEEFYALVNSSGRNLNNPEISKAKYYDTKFLELCTKLANSEMFSSLNIFTNKAMERINDIEYIGELIALLKFGLTDKKNKVAELFENDLARCEVISLTEKFNKVIEVIKELDRYQQFQKTRYRQHADFYSLFYFIHSNIGLSIDTFTKYYDILLDIAPSISPSNYDCAPLQYYARNCVTQSNGKTARSERNSFLNNLLRNPDPKPNKTQEDIIIYLKLDNSKELIKIEDMWTLAI